MSQSADTERPSRETADPDTSSHEQVQGKRDPSEKPLKEQPRQPHERDESARATGTHERPARTGADMKEGLEDVERGLVDTERRGVPNDVPHRK